MPFMVYISCTYSAYIRIYTYTRTYILHTIPCAVKCNFFCAMLWSTGGMYLFPPTLQVGLLSNPGRPVTGERSDIEVARSAALALWSCSKSKSNKMVT